MSVARLVGRIALLAAFVLPLVVTGLADRVGGAQAATAPSSAAVVRVPSPQGLGPELVEYRTRTSQTFGGLESAPNATLHSQTSLNYRASDGSWKPIDNTLVASADGAGYENRANSLRYRLPRNLSAPFRVENGQHWLSFALLGANSRATASVAGARATYQDALPGVDLALDARSDFLKESITLAGPSAAVPLTFRVRHSAGLSARKDSQGGIELIDQQGERQLGFAPPFMYDAAGERASFSKAIGVRLTPQAEGFEVVVTPDRAWLTSPSRKWPVTIDPTTGGPYTDCTLTSGSGAATSFCAAQTLQIGNDGRVNRALSTWNLGGIPAMSTSPSPS